MPVPLEFDYAPPPRFRWTRLLKRIAIAAVLGFALIASIRYGGVLLDNWRLVRLQQAAIDAGYGPTVKAKWDAFAAAALKQRPANVLAVVRLDTAYGPRTVRLYIDGYVTMLQARMIHSATLWAAPRPHSTESAVPQFVSEPMSLRCIGIRPHPTERSRATLEFTNASGSAITVELAIVNDQPVIDVTAPVPSSAPSSRPSGG